MSEENQKIQSMLINEAPKYGNDDEGNVTEKVHLNPAEGHYGIEIPPCVWHTIVVLESGTVIYEIKQGPFAPLIPENLASWAPPATDEEAARVFMQRMLEL